MNANELADKFKLDPLNAEVRSEVIELMIKSYSESKTFQAAYNLLLQDMVKQQAEIERLNKLSTAISNDCNNTALERNRAYDEIEALKSGGEPIAYVSLERWKVCDSPEHCFSKRKEGDGDVAVYTHPAKPLTEDEVSKYWYNKGHEDGRKLVVVNTLTQAQILKVIEKTHFADGYLNDNLIRFAEAILKEAGEK